MLLRPYQQSAVEQIRESFRSGNRKVVMCAPTGSGKTATFSSIAAASYNNGRRVLILTDRRELRKQSGGTLGRFGISPGIIEPGCQQDWRIPVQVGMVKTFLNRAKKSPILWDWPELVIVDECHRGEFKKVLKGFSESTYIIGATATPVSTTKSDPLHNYFDDIVSTVGIPELIQQGSLVPAITYSVEIDKSSLKKQGGEYTEESQMSMFDKRERYSGVVEKWQQFAHGRRTMCFCVNIEHSKKTAAAFQSAGVPAMHIDGTTPESERESVLARHQSGEFPILCNVGITTAGYDDPEISCIIFDRVTTSLALWLQCCGRGSRPFPGKENFIILDMGANYDALGLWEEDRDWLHVFRNPGRANEGIAPTKLCPQCQAIIRASAKNCEYCFYEIPAKERDEEELNVKFGQVTKKKKKEKPIPLPKPPRALWPGLSIPEIAQYIKTGTYKLGWATRLLMERSQPEKALTEFAEYMGYKETWARRILSI